MKGLELFSLGKPRAGFETASKLSRLGPNLPSYHVPIPEMTMVHYQVIALFPADMVLL